VYPDIARKLQLHGSVRVEVTIAPSGAVTRTEVLGGNPLLSRAVLEALAKWKYDAGPEETKTLNFVFDPAN
jgi:TonB family protein